MGSAQAGSEALWVRLLSSRKSSAVTGPLWELRPWGRVSGLYPARRAISMPSLCWLTASAPVRMRKTVCVAYVPGRA